MWDRARRFRRFPAGRHHSIYRGDSGLSNAIESFARTQSSNCNIDRIPIPSSPSFVVVLLCCFSLPNFVVCNDQSHALVIGFPCSLDPAELEALEEED